LSALRSGQLAPIQTDYGLVAAARCGDDRAFGELYSRYGRRVVSYNFGMLGDYARAEDVAQEVFISALRRMRETERPIAFKPWVYEIARNACIDEFRRTRRVREVPLDSGEEPDRVERRLESPTGSPVAALERRQQLDDLRGAFRGLTETHHKIIVLRELEGLSYTEIGQRMGMTRPVVESTLFRARRRLGAEYEEIASGRRCEQVQAVVDAGGEKAVRALGIRQRRRLARHLAHCQPCRRFAHLAGVDDSVLKGPGLAEKIAAILPIPAFLRWRRGPADEVATNASGSHSVGVMQSMPRVAQFVDPASPALGFGRATAAVVAAVVVAGGGVVGTLTTGFGGGGTQSKHAVAAHVRSAPGAPPGSTSGQTGTAATGLRAGARANAAAVTSGGPSGGAPKSQSNTAQPSSSNAASSGPVVSESHPGLASGGSKQTPSSETNSSQNSPSQAPSQSGSPQLPQLPLPSGAPLPTLPTLPPVNTPQLPQLNLPSVPSVGSLIGTVRGNKLLP
jgi:RNA polymerase sigma factor (sigma-70 family)